MRCGGECSERDLVRGWSAVALWCVPAMMIAVGVVLPQVRAMLWIPSFAVMGVACLVNARGCGRLHCFITGPLFILGALMTALDAFSILEVDWSLTVLVVGIGTLLAYSLEWLRGKYVGTSVS